MKLITALLLVPFVTGQRKSLIQEIVSQIKSSPRHQSPSPSYTSDRKFDVIGVGDLPLQTGTVAGPSQYAGSDEAREIEGQSNSPLPFLAPLPVQLTEELSPDHSDHSPDPLESQGSQFIARPSVSHRRRQHNNGLRFRPLGEVLSKFISPNRNGKPPSRGPSNGRPRRRPSSDRNLINQDDVDEFLPMTEHNRDHRPPERNDHRSKPSKPSRRKPISINIKNPFKSILEQSPLKKKHKRPLKDAPFRPPSKVFKGFAPSFEGSVSLEDARRQHEREKYENGFLEDKRPHFNEPKRKRRRKPHRDGSKRPGRPGPKRPSGHDFEMTNHPSHNDHLEEENYNRFAHDSPKPSLISDEMAGFVHNLPPGKRPSQDSLRPFGEEVAPFPAQAEGPGPVRPKRQRPRPSHSNQPDLENFQEAAFNDIPEGDLGFFNEVNFPDISSFGVGWDPKKIRRKRDAYEVPLYYKRESKRPRLNRSQRQRRPSRQSNRRQGPLGFWDDPDFDADFFNGGSPTPQNFPSFDSYSNNYNQPYYPQSSRPKPKHPTRGYTTQKIKQQTRPKIVPKRYVERYAIDNSYATVDQDNSILGSGNFEILKGGTFYDKDDYLRPYSNNKPPRHNSYYGDNDIFSNFRDFADIKGDAKEYKNNNYDEGYYYR